MISRVLLICSWLTVLNIEAQRYVTNLVKQKSAGKPATFFEVYGQGGLTRAANLHPALNVCGLEIMGLRTLRPDGQVWDFSRAKDRAWALRLIREQKPRWSIAAPPCTAVSILNWNLNYGRMSKADVGKKLHEGLEHLKFV